MATIKVLLRTSKLNERGLAPLYLRITKHRKAQFISIGVYLKPEEWDEKKGKVRKSNRTSTRLNAFIAQKIAEAESIAVDLETKSKSVHTHNIKETILGKPPVAFFPHAENYVVAFQGAEKFGTYKRGKTVIDKLKAYVGGRTLYFDELTVAFLKQYEDYLTSVLKNKTNIVESNFKFIRTIVRKAVNEDILPLKSP